MSRRLRNLRQVARRDGLRGVGPFLARRARSRLMTREDQRWDAEHEVRTEGWIELDGLDVASPNKAHGFVYGPSPVRLVTAMLDFLGDVDGSTFVDFGSGLGRVLLLASMHNFRSVIGVEFSPELHKAAVANVSTFHAPDQRCRDIECVCLDAAAFEIPGSDCVLFFGNPFAEQVMRTVIGHIARSHATNGQRIRVLYQQLRNEPVINRTANLDLLRAEPFLVERRPRMRSFADTVLLGSHEVVTFDSLPEPARPRPAT